MTTTNYVSLKSVLYDLSLSISERYWNEAIMTEWAAKAFRMMNIEVALVPTTALLTVTSHKTTLPSDFKYLIQMAKYTGRTSEYDLEDETLPETTTWTLADSDGIGWKAMRLSSNPYHSSICLSSGIYTCANCAYEYSVSPNLTVTTNFESGTVMVAYLSYAKSEDGDLLIPDDETVKEALRNYILFRYWETKALMMEEGARAQRDYYLARWQVVKLSARNVDLPDINTLENIKNEYNRLVPRENRFNQLFLTLGNRENVNF